MWAPEVVLHATLAVTPPSAADVQRASHVVAPKVLARATAEEALLPAAAILPAAAQEVRVWAAVHAVAATVSAALAEEASAVVHVAEAAASAEVVHVVAAEAVADAKQKCLKGH